MAQDPPTQRRPGPQELAEAFVTPMRQAGRKEAAHPPHGTQLLVPFETGEIAAWKWGEAPCVLLVHGWQADHGDMLGFVEPLLARGIGTVAMDLPAHGASAGSVATIPRLAKAVRAVGDAVGSVRGLIAHSMGAAVSTVAVYRGLHVERMVLISAPARYEDQARAMVERFGFSEAEWSFMRARLEELGTELGEVDLPRLAKTMAPDALFIHSQDDRVVSIDDARETSSAWPASSLATMEGLGHNRILSSAETIAVAVEFVSRTC